ncbi:MAG: shikimate dehydrogenase [Elusimicrobiota bacterium]
MITGKTKVVGVIGYPIEHSMSPVMHNAALQESELDFVYVPFEVNPAEVERAIKAIRSYGIIGINVTIPHKETVVRFLDKLDESAKHIRAVNTIHNKDGKLVGYNTDIYGFITSLKDIGGFEPREKSVFVLGSGGAARAVVYGLVKEKVERLFISDINNARARSFAAQVKYFFPRADLKVVHNNGHEIKECIKECQLFVNATPVGMKHGDCCPIDKNFIHDRLFVYDVIYNRETELLEHARDRGVKCMNGADMLVLQGARAFEIWTGKKAPVELMKKMLLKKLTEKR